MDRAREAGVEGVHRPEDLQRAPRVGHGSPEKRGFVRPPLAPGVAGSGVPRLGIVLYEGRLRRMGEEVRKATRRINVLTVAILPRLRSRMRAVRLALEEREREDVFRMKRFKKAAGKDQERP